jgi:hypothetical protein
MKALLISKTPIVVQIFRLVCSKLDLDVAVKESLDINHSFDIIVVDQEFIDDDFNKLRTKSKRIGAISSEELNFDKNRDFLLKRPFLPSDLTDTLQAQMRSIREKKKEEPKEEKVEVVKEEVKETPVPKKDPQEDYMDMLAGSIIDAIDQKTSEADIDDKIEFSDESSIITIDDIETVNATKVFNTDEVNKIQELLDKPKLEDVAKDESDKNGSDGWIDISEIIDDAIVEASQTTIQEKNVVITLSQYTMKELIPLFRKLDQNLIDDLTKGKSINVTLKLN